MIGDSKGQTDNFSSFDVISLLVAHLTSLPKGGGKLTREGTNVRSCTRVIEHATTVGQARIHVGGETGIVPELFCSTP